VNGHHDLERRLADFYDAEAPRQAPDRILHAALATIDTTRQRRVLIRVPRRFQTMNTFARAAVAAAAVVAVGAFVLAVVGPFRLSGTGPGAAATPSPSVGSAAPSTSASAPPALTQTFTSVMHGISISYPAPIWTPRAASEPWTSGIPFQDSPFTDAIVSGSDAFLGLASQPLGGKTGEAWIAEISSDPGWGDTCPIRSEPITVDGASGVLVTHCPDAQVLTAMVTVAGRGYLVVLYNAGDKGWFEQILGTVQLNPAAAVDPVPSGSPVTSPPASAS
jgi:hypothetical protein